MSNNKNEVKSTELRALALRKGYQAVRQQCPGTWVLFNLETGKQVGRLTPELTKALCQLDLDASVDDHEPADLNAWGDSKAALVGFLTKLPDKKQGG